MYTITSVVYMYTHVCYKQCCINVVYIIHVYMQSSSDQTGGALALSVMESCPV